MLDYTRKIQRFSIALPARVESNNGSSTKDGLDLFCRDVSAGGAFFLTSQPLDVGTHVVVRMLLEPVNLRQSLRKKAQVTICGEVLRTDETGMAVRFDRRYKISSIIE